MKNKEKPSLKGRTGMSKETKKKYLVHMLTNVGDRWFGVFPSYEKSHEWMDSYFQDDPDYEVEEFEGKLPKYVTSKLEKVNEKGELE